MFNPLRGCFDLAMLTPSFARAIVVNALRTFFNPERDFTIIATGKTRGDESGMKGTPKWVQPLIRIKWQYFIKKKFRVVNKLVVLKLHFSILQKINDLIRTRQINQL